MLSAPPYRRIIECTEVFIFMSKLLEWRSVAVVVSRADLIEEHKTSLLRNLYIILSASPHWRIIESTEVFIFVFQLLEWRSVPVAVSRAGLIESITLV